MGQVTELLNTAANGSGPAFDELYGLLYAELRKLAHSRVRRSGDLTLLDTTALVHEAYLRLGKTGTATFRDRAQFMSYAARVMRSIVVDEVRRREAQRHGGGAAHVEFDETELVPQRTAHDEEIVRVHESLDALGSIDERLVRVVEMRYFAGMSETETAMALGMAVRTVARDWEKARLFLHASLR